MTVATNSPRARLRARTKKDLLPHPRNAGQSGQARMVVLALVCLLAGICIGAFLIFRTSNRDVPTSGSSPEAESTLSAGTKSVLKELSAPVEIRFYSLLDPATTSEALRQFAGRVNQLLTAYEREAGGKIKVARHITPADAADQAAADGLKVFNLDKGEACYLGMSLVCREQKETMPQLSPDWEAALESDLSRALVRVSTVKPTFRAQAAASGPAQPDAKTIAEIKNAIPNLESVSLPEATQTLRLAALKEFTEVTQAMERAVKDAEQRATEATKSGSETEKQAAVKNLLQVQAEHREKLQQVTARLQAQITALEQIKKK